MSYDLHGSWENFAAHSSPLVNTIDLNDLLTVVRKMSRTRKILKCYAK